VQLKKDFSIRGPIPAPIRPFRAQIARWL
jgi:hypothetical protein